MKPTETTTMRHVLPACALMFLASACLSPSEAPQRRYFDPGAGVLDSSSSETSADAKSVALGRVSAEAHLRESMVWRVSELEIALDADNVWVADVPVLVENALRARLFDSGRFSSGPGGDVKGIDVHVVHFEGSLESEPAARVTLLVRLKGIGRGRTRVQTFSAEEPLDARAPSALAAGMRVALGDAVSQIADWLDE